MCSPQKIESRKKSSFTSHRHHFGRNKISISFLIIYSWLRLTQTCNQQVNDSQRSNQIVARVLQMFLYEHSDDNENIPWKNQLAKSIKSTLNVMILLNSPIIVIKMRSPSTTVIKDIRMNSRDSFFSPSLISLEVLFMLVTLYTKVSFGYVEFKRSMKNSGRLSIETKPIISGKSKKKI